LLLSGAGKQHFFKLVGDPRLNGDLEAEEPRQIIALEAGEGKQMINQESPTWAGKVLELVC